MKRRSFLGLSSTVAVSFFGAGAPVIQMVLAQSKTPQVGLENELNPNTRWLREARWGVFSHYLAGLPGEPIPEDMNGKMWNKRINSFQVSKLADQLEEIKAPYFFITIGGDADYFCSPNSTYEKLFGSSSGRLSERDLVAELAAELIPRGIKMCASLPALGGKESIEEQNKYQKVISEWSERWGKSISAWWIDDGRLPGNNIYDAYTKAFKAGNKDALIAFNPGSIKFTYRLQGPATEFEDYFAGQVDWYLPTSAVRLFDNTEFWVGPNYAGDQLHFMTFAGDSWGKGDPRFPDDLVIGWTEHANNYQGTISWDVPLRDSGVIPKKHFKQLAALSKYIV